MRQGLEVTRRLFKPMALPVGCGGGLAGLLALGAALAGCGDNGAGTSPPKASAADAAATDAAPDVAATSDVGPADFGKPCNGDSDCQSGNCAWAFAGRLCSKSCNGPADCPSGWACRSAEGGGDAWCAPADALLCAPCVKDADCHRLGDPAAQCVSAGAAGSFCAIACTDGNQCPSSFGCDTSSGKKLCRPAAGTLCTCPAYAKDQGLATTCANANTLGQCSGFRACGPAGLGPCDALPPAAEACNAKDDDCDGATDEAFAWQNPAGGNALVVGQVCGAGVCGGGEVVCATIASATCSTANKASPEQCNGVDDDCDGLTDDGVCACKSNADCATQQDGKLCNGSLYCDPVTHACALNPASVVKCQLSMLPCTVATCVEPQAPETSPVCKSLPVADGTPCDDGLASTTGEVCSAGACTQGVVVVPCTVSADCAKYEDGDLCNGTLFCNKATKLCQVNPATAVKCPDGSDTLCSKNLCVPASGACAMTAVNQGKACDDGFACTAGEACDKGACSAAANTCKCSKDSDCNASEDGNLCNGTLFCDKAKAVCVVNPATVIACASGKDTACSLNTCVPTTGQCAMTAVANGVPCDADGSTCSPADTCQAGACKADSNVCACKVDGDCASKEDGNLCNGTLYCDKAAGTCLVNPTTVVQCATGQNTACLVATCNPIDGQCGPVALPVGTTCSASDACLSAGLCTAAGVCTPGNVKSCNDANPCTLDTCDGKLGCVHSPAAATCTDGDACTAGDACTDGTCKAGTAIACDDGNPCTNDACAKLKGCTALPNAATCTDGNACTLADACLGGACLGGAAAGCDDKDACTTDSCDKASGCKHAALSGCTPCANSGACQDGNVCTSEFCVSGLCQFAAVEGQGCEDGNACTTGDSCAASACKAGPPKACNDGDACTVDACEAKTGCTTAPAATCDDKNSCTDDSCNAKTGCSATANSKACDADGNPCTADQCAGGKCTPGGPAACDDGNACTDNACEPKTGCAAANNTKPCNDGNPCSTGETCTAGKCGGPTTPTACDDQLSCTADSCDPAKGCVHDGSKSDGATCGELPNGVCKGGTCQCGAGYAAVSVDVVGEPTKACEATGPVWGQRPIKPVGVYTVQDVAGGKVVLDSQTKLMWQQGTAPVIKDLANAKGYCDGLVIGTFTDWRVPSAHELATVADYSVAFPGPAIDAAFVGTPAAEFWSTTPFLGDAATAWCMHFETGSLQYYETKNLMQTRCVRAGGVGAVAARYALSAAGGVATDKWTQLHWQRQATGGVMLWQAAKDHCAGLSLEGAGWRLPTVRELHGLVDYAGNAPTIDQTAFVGAVKGTYWSVTPRAGSAVDVWVVTFSGGAIVYSTGAQTHNVRCVRD